MAESEDPPARRSRIARAAVERLATGRVRDVDEAVEDAARALRIDDRAQRVRAHGGRAGRPTRRELRAHAQALEESVVGPAGRRRRIVESLREVIEVLRVLEAMVVVEDGSSDARPAAYGRAARAEFDLDPVAHLRVVTSMRAGRLAEVLERSGVVGSAGSDPSGEVACGSIETRHGRMDELAFDGRRVAFRIVRVPPALRTDPQLDLVRGRRVARAEREDLDREIERITREVGPA